MEQQTEIDVSEFVKELRRGVKNGSWSNSRIIRLLRDIYTKGYVTAYEEASKKIYEVVSADKNPTASDHVDGEQLQPEGIELGTGEGAVSNDSDSGAASE